MTFRIGAALPVMLIVFAPTMGSAQTRTASAFDEQAAALIAPAMLRPTIELRHEQQQEPPKPEDDMSTSGFFLGIIGMLAGGALGSQIGQSECPSRAVDKACVGRYAYTGALISGTAFIPIGVHLATKKPRRLVESYGLAILTGTAFYYGMKAIPGSPIAMAPFLAAPIQVYTSVKMEKPGKTP